MDAQVISIERCDDLSLNFYLIPYRLDRPGPRRSAVLGFRRDKRSGLN